MNCNEKIFKKPFFKNFIKIFVLTVISVFIFACHFSGKTKEIIVYHTNDIHARALVDGLDDSFNYANLATFLDTERGAAKNILYLDAGDAIQGLPIAGISNGLNAVIVMNLLSLDAMAIGNHEFDYGISNLIELKNFAKFPMLSINIRKDGNLVFDSYIIKDIDGIKFGIFGITTPETHYKTNPKNVVGYEFEDIVSTSKEMVKTLREDLKVDYVIAVAHVGREGEHTTTKLAEEVKGIDLIIDGHDHAPLKNGLKVGKTLIVKAGEYANNLGKVKLVFDKNNKFLSNEASLIPASEVKKSKPKAEVLHALNEINEANKKIMDEVIAKTPIELYGQRDKVRKEETLLGQIIADTMQNITKSDFSIINGGGIRDSIAKGEIKRGDILKVLPFGNIIVTQEIPGSIIKDILETSVSQYPKNNGGFLHVSGITFTADMTKQAGERVSDILVQGKPLDTDKNYVLSTNDFIAIGGDNYSMLKDYKILAEFVSLDEAFVVYLNSLRQEEMVFTPRINVLK